jgi:alpha-beta hydrolase superfamily lysophospholipase
VFFKNCASKDKEYKEMEGAYHEMHNEIEPCRGEVIEKYINWIKQRAVAKI